MIRVDTDLSRVDKEARGILKPNAVASAADKPAGKSSETNHDEGPAKNAAQGKHTGPDAEIAHIEVVERTPSHVSSMVLRSRRSSREEISAEKERKAR